MANVNAAANRFAVVASEGVIKSLDHEGRIEILRRLTGASAVTLSLVPPWFRRAVKQAVVRAGGEPRFSDMMDFPYAACLKLGVGYGWLDHWGTAKLGDRELFVSEPYLSCGHVEEAIRFAEVVGLDLMISPASWWNPGRTTRLSFSQKSA